MSSTILTFLHLCDPLNTAKNLLFPTILHRSPKILPTVKQMMAFLILCLLLKSFSEPIRAKRADQGSWINKVKCRDTDFQAERVDKNTERTP